MPVDWTTPELTYLKGQLELGRVVLFAGAGFSYDARNRAGNRLPLGVPLAENLAAQAGLPYQKGDSLADVFAAVGPIIGANALWQKLSELYTVDSCDDWYKLVMSVAWRRIYTTNIDTLFQYLAPYASKQRLRKIVRGEPSQERDHLFEDVQCVHLHGHVEHRLNGLTFTIPDFAKHTAKPDPWYQSLVDDLHTCPTIFVGTTLEEPILPHYLNRTTAESER